MDAANNLAIIFKYQAYKFIAGVDESSLRDGNGVLNTQDLYEARSRHMVPDIDLVWRAVSSDPSSLKRSSDRLSSEELAVIAGFYNSVPKHQVLKDFFKDFDAIGPHSHDLVYAPNWSIILGDHERFARFLLDTRTTAQDIEAINKTLSDMMSDVSHDYVALDLRKFDSLEALDISFVLAISASSVVASYAFFVPSVDELFEGKKEENGKSFSESEWTYAKTKKNSVRDAVKSCNQFREYKDVFTAKNMKIPGHLIEPIHKLFDLFQLWQDKDVVIVFPNDKQEYCAVKIFDFDYGTKQDLKRAIARCKAKILLPDYTRAVQELTNI